MYREPAVSSPRSENFAPAMECSGGQALHLTGSMNNSADIVALDEALLFLSKFDERKSQIVELK
jgi:hypothetical protein